MITLVLALILAGASAAIVTVRVLRRRTTVRNRLIAGTVVGIGAALVACVLLVVPLGVALVVASVMTIPVFLVLLAEVGARWYASLDREFGASAEPGTDVNLQLKTAAFYQSFEYVSSLPAAKRDHGITLEYWTNLQVYRHRAFKRDANGSIVGNADFASPGLNVVDGLRVTVKQPVHVTRRLLLIGGSTIFCYESPDELTVASHLQSVLASSHPGFCVENHGVGGATLMDRADYIRRLDLSNVGAVVCLFGDNEVGINAPRRWTPSTDSQMIGVARRFVVGGASLSVFLRLLRDKWYRLEYSDTRVDDSKLSRVYSSASTLADWLRDCGCPLVLLLQPNLFTKSRHSSEERQMIASYPTHWEKVVREGFDHFRSLFATRSDFSDISDAFDDLNPGPFLDWAHVNSDGNRRIAERIIQELHARQILGGGV